MNSFNDVSCGAFTFIEQKSIGVEVDDIEDVSPRLEVHAATQCAVEVYAASTQTTPKLVDQGYFLLASLRVEFRMIIFPYSIE